MKPNEKSNIDAWFNVLDEYIVELLMTPRQLEQKGALVTLREGALTLHEEWEQHSNLAMGSATADTHELALVPDTLSTVLEIDPIIKLLMRHNCRELRFGRRPIRARATIDADGWVLDSDTGMMMTSIDGWIYARALEQRDDGYYPSAEVDQYTQVDVRIEYQWIRLDRFLTGACSGDEETPPALLQAA